MLVVSSIYISSIDNRQLLRCLAALIAVSLPGSLLFAAPQTNDEPAAKSSDRPATTVLVLVDGRPITEGDLGFMMLTHRVPEELRSSRRKHFVEQLIDRRLIRSFLARRKTTASEIELDRQVQRIRELIRKGGDDPKEILARLGYTEKTLREELALPLAWKRHIADIVTQKRLETYFTEHRQELNGTRLRASHIFIKVPTDKETDELKAAEQKLQGIRADIVGGKVTFAEAAKKHSQAPSSEQGGDVGFFPYRGRMPIAFTRVAFALEVGEVSRPFRTPFGVHLVTVTERKPGDLSLEDARPLIWNRISQELWAETVAAERTKAKIEWKARIE